MFLTSQHNGTGIPRDEKAFEQFCFNNHDFGPYCARKWLSRCTNQVYLTLANRLYINPMQKNLREFCDPQGNIRPRFIKIAPCVIDKVKLSRSYRQQCVRGLQAAGEWIHQQALQDKNLTKFYRNTCCAFNQWEQCILDHLLQECGSEAKDVFPYLIHFNSMEMLLFLCPKDAFNPTDPEQCKPEEFRPPKHFIPKGIHSNSILSSSFSYFCPNVGYGIDLSRDY